MLLLVMSARTLTKFPDIACAYVLVNYGMVQVTSGNYSNDCDRGACDDVGTDRPGHQLHGHDLGDSGTSPGCSRGAAAS